MCPAKDVLTGERASRLLFALHQRHRMALTGLDIEATVIDDFNSECLASVPDFLPSGLRVIRELEAIIARRGKPAMIVPDNGTELTSNAVLRWTASS